MQASWRSRQTKEGNWEEQYIWTLNVHVLVFKQAAVLSEENERSEGGEKTKRKPVYPGNGFEFTAVGHQDGRGPITLRTGNGDEIQGGVVNWFTAQEVNDGSGYITRMLPRSLR